MTTDLTAPATNQPTTTKAGQAALAAAAVLDLVQLFVRGSPDTPGSGSSSPPAVSAS